MSSQTAQSPTDGLTHALARELFDLGTAIDLIGQATATRLGINQTDLVCLELLVRHGPMSASEVAAALGLTTAAISAMATRLESGGYATRETDRRDRRRVLLRASPTGGAQALRLSEGFYRACAALRDEFPDEDQRALLVQLGRFRELLREHTEAIRTRP